MTRRSILQLHVLLAIMLAYFGLYGTKSEQAIPVWGMVTYGAVVGGFLAGLFFVPAAWWGRQMWVVGVFLGDVVLTTVALYFTQGFQGDLYLVYFLVIFMAGLANSIKTSLLIGGVAGFVYLGGTYQALKAGEVLTPIMLMRLPFFFVVALVCSYFARMVGHEQIKRREAQRMGRMLNQQVRETKEHLLKGQEQLGEIQSAWREALGGQHRLQEKIDRLEQRVRMLTQSTHDIVVVLADRERVVEVNDRVQEILGISPAAVMGQTFRSWLFDSEVQSTFPDLLAAISEERPRVALSLRMRTVKDKPVMMEWVFNRVISSRGTVLIHGLGAVTLR